MATVVGETDTDIRVGLKVSMAVREFEGVEAVPGPAMFVPFTVNV